MAPSLNHRYVSRNFVLSKEWRDYKATVAEICQAYKITPLLGDVFMSIKWYRARKQGDCDGKIKAVQDALEGWAYENDKQIKTLRITRSDEERDNPRMVVHVRPWRDDG